MQELTLNLTGTHPLLMHCPRSVNTLDEGTRELKKYTGKRKKTDEDVAIIARLEWNLGLYWDEVNGPYIPGVNVEIMLRDAGKLTKQGAAVTRGVLVTQSELPLQFSARKAKQSKQDLWDQNLKWITAVGNQKARVMRCRPMFGGWSLSVPLMVQEDVLNVEDVVAIAERGGVMIGLGDYRPRFGRFTVEVATSV